MLHYDMPLFRPPSEGDNLILQATLGCSFNQCSFCSMYKSKSYQARPLDKVFADIDLLAEMNPYGDRVFLADGDALALPTESLVLIAERLAHRLPNLTRISSYATPANLLRKSEADLNRLKAHKLSLVYLGVESGSAEVLRRIAKGATPDGIADAINRARAAGIKVSATVILGLGGKRLAEQHARDTAALINRAPPNFLSTLQLTVLDDVADSFLARWDGDFQPQDDHGILEEQRLLLESLDPPSPVIFRSNHASNCLALAGTLPKDRDRLISDLNGAMHGDRSLRPMWMRGL